MRNNVRRCFWNLILSSIVFLPIFILGAWFELFIRDGKGSGSFSYVLAEGALLYIVMIVPTILAALLYSSALLFIPGAWPDLRRRIVALLLSFIVPIAVFLSPLPLGYFFVLAPVATVIAALSYGMFVRT